MNVIILVFCFISYLNFVAPDPSQRINKIIRVINDRRSDTPSKNRLSLNEVPWYGRSQPGHSLIKPGKTMLNSAVKFPKDEKNDVFGDLDKLGIMYDQTSQRLSYSGFRKGNDILANILKLLKNDEYNNKNSAVVIIQPKSKTKLKSKAKRLKKKDNLSNAGRIFNYDDSLVTAAFASKESNIIKNKMHRKEAKQLQSLLSNLRQILNDPKSKDFELSSIRDKEDKKAKQIQDVLNSRGQVEFNIIPKESSSEEKAEKTKAYINGRIPVHQEKSNSKYNVSANWKKIQDFVKLIKPGGKANFSINGKNKYTQEFLNNEVVLPRGAIPVFIDRDHIKDRKKLLKALHSGQHTIKFITPENKTLYERTKSIQNFLNNYIPVVNARETRHETSSERDKNVQYFLNHLVQGKEKLSLSEKTKHIQDFLNNEVPGFIHRGTLKSQNNIYQDFYNDPNARDYVPSQINEEENTANEIVDPNSSEEDDGLWHPSYRRNTGKKPRKHRNRDSKYESREKDHSGESASSDYEKNPGNPFTIYRNKYKQNWMWNHFMDGDHMNINPFGPPFAHLGPSGADLFFGRKWWYYNQDDYKPMG